MRSVLPLAFAVLKDGLFAGQGLTLGDRRRRGRDGQGENDHEGSHTFVRS